MAGRHTSLFPTPEHAASRKSRHFLVSGLKKGGLRTAALAVATVLAVFTGLLGAARPASADHLMCGLKAERRTQTVSIDPNLLDSGVTHEDVLAAFQPWNDLFVKYHGFPIFAGYNGAWWEADVLLTAHGWNRTWVATRCLPGFVQRGANHSIVFLGRDDAWRNRQMLSHELGHALGFGDHGAPGEHVSGHIGFVDCASRYMGVMSYCTSPQSWFLDRVMPGYTLDGQLVERYW